MIWFCLFIFSISYCPRHTARLFINAARERFSQKEWSTLVWTVFGKSAPVHVILLPNLLLEPFKMLDYCRYCLSIVNNTFLKENWVQNTCSSSLMVQPTRLGGISTQSTPTFWKVLQRSLLKSTFFLSFSLSFSLFVCLPVCLSFSLSLSHIHTRTQTQTQYQHTADVDSKALHHKLYFYWRIHLTDFFV